MALEQLAVYMHRMKLNPLSHTTLSHTKNYIKEILDLNVRAEIIKLLEKNME